MYTIFERFAIESHFSNGFQNSFINLNISKKSMHIHNTSNKYTNHVFHQKVIFITTVTLAPAALAFNIVENKPTYEDNVIVNITQHNDQEKPPATPLFALTNNESPFLIGVRGRNISLIRKYTHMLIKRRVSMIHQRIIAW